MSYLAQLADSCAPLLRQPLILKTRRNHSLEHATIHLLEQRGHKLSGRSSQNGFVLLGDAPTDAIEECAREALRRMKAGEAQLALHPNCGTNLVTAGFLATAVAFLGFAGRRWLVAWGRFPTVMTLSMLAVFLSTPLGMSLQRHFTTEADLGDMELVSVSRDTVSLPFLGQPVVVHRVVTAQA